MFVPICAAALIFLMLIAMFLVSPWTGFVYLAALIFVAYFAYREFKYARKIEKVLEEKELIETTLDSINRGEGRKGLDAWNQEDFKFIARRIFGINKAIRLGKKYCDSWLLKPFFEGDWKSITPIAIDECPKVAIYALRYK